MAQPTATTFEEIDRIVQAADLREFTAQPRAAAAAPGDVLKQICAIWKIVGPIVRAIANLPIIPQKWRDALKVFADLLDRLCAG